MNQITDIYKFNKTLKIHIDFCITFVHTTIVYTNVYRKRNKKHR